jgi:hypothetical protein
MKYVLIAGIVIIGIFLIALQFIPIGKEPLTELYFENHTSLPNVLFENKTYNFTFTAHNLEYQEMDYTYNVTIEFYGKTFPMDTGNFTLKDNESVSVTESFTYTGNFERAKINVDLVKNTFNPLQRDPNLINKSIDIDFWVQEYATTKIVRLPD